MSGWLLDEPQLTKALDMSWRHLTVRDEGVRIHDLADRTGLSRQHLSKVFHREIGLPPKIVGRIARCHRAIRLLTGRNPPSLATLANLCGYTDHGHLDRDFRLLIGTTPTALLRPRNTTDLYLDSLISMRPTPPTGTKLDRSYETAARGALATLLCKLGLSIPAGAGCTVRRTGPSRTATLPTRHVARIGLAPRDSAVLPIIRPDHPCRRVGRARVAHTVGEQEAGQLHPMLFGEPEYAATHARIPAEGERTPDQEPDVGRLRVGTVGRGRGPAHAHSFREQISFQRTAVLASAPDAHSDAAVAVNAVAGDLTDRRPPGVGPLPDAQRPQPLSHRITLEPAPPTLHRLRGKTVFGSCHQRGREDDTPGTTRLTTRHRMRRDEARCPREANMTFICQLSHEGRGGPGCPADQAPRPAGLE